MEVVSFEKFALTEEDIQGGVLGSDMASLPRPDGLHWSNIVRRMSLKKYKKNSTPSWCYREVGFVWEMMLEAVFKQRMKHHRRQRINQLSFEVDDVHMTPDGLVFDGPPSGPGAMGLIDLYPTRQVDGSIVYADVRNEGGIWVPTGSLVPAEDYIEEYKATWRSMRNVGVAPNYTLFFDEFWDWHVQVMGYCRAAHVTRADFYILFINGDYKPMIPDALYISVRYSQQEMDEIWEQGQNHKDES